MGAAYTRLGKEAEACDDRATSAISMRSLTHKKGWSLNNDCSIDYEIIVAATRTIGADLVASGPQLGRVDDIRVYSGR